MCAVYAGSLEIGAREELASQMAVAVTFIVPWYGNVPDYHATTSGTAGRLKYSLEAHNDFAYSGVVFNELLLTLSYDTG